jgi:hypothetical protein
MPPTPSGQPGRLPGESLAPDGPDVALRVRLHWILHPQRGLHLLRPVQVGEKPELREFRVHEHALEPTTVCQGTDVPVNIDQIEPRGDTRGRRRRSESGRSRAPGGRRRGTDPRPWGSPRASRHRSRRSARPTPPPHPLKVVAARPRPVPPCSHPGGRIGIMGGILRGADERKGQRITFPQAQPESVGDRSSGRAAATNQGLLQKGSSPGRRQVNHASTSTPALDLLHPAGQERVRLIAVEHAMVDGERHIAHRPHLHHLLPAPLPRHRPPFQLADAQDG